MLTLLVTGAIVFGGIAAVMFVLMMAGPIDWFRWTQITGFIALVICTVFTVIAAQMAEQESTQRITITCSEVSE
jgi:predicted membrane channel-forming protein YqfA (hemolysin III family)